jgi:serine protease
LIPFGLMALSFGSKRLRPWIAGLAAGTGAYLVSVATLSEAAGPLGHTALLAWCGLNAAACIWIARTNLAETK